MSCLPSTSACNSPCSVLYDCRIQTCATMTRPLVNSCTGFAEETSYRTYRSRNSVIRPSAPRLLKVKSQEVICAGEGRNSELDNERDIKKGNSLEDMDKCSNKQQQQLQQQQKELQQQQEQLQQQQKQQLQQQQELQQQQLQQLQQQQLQEQLQQQQQQQQLQEQLQQQQQQQLQQQLQQQQQLQEQQQQQQQQQQLQQQQQQQLQEQLQQQQQLQEQLQQQQQLQKQQQQHKQEQQEEYKKQQKQRSVEMEPQRKSSQANKKSGHHSLWSAVQILMSVWCHYFCGLFSEYKAHHSRHLQATWPFPPPPPHFRGDNSRQQPSRSSL